MTQSSYDQYCTFWIGQRLYGVHILTVREITRQWDVTPIHHAPQAALGYLNIRGRIHLVLDLAQLLGFEATKTAPQSGIIIFKPGIVQDCGVLVERIGDVVTVTPEHVTPAAETGDTQLAENPFIEGICRLQNQLLVLLNPKDLLNVLAQKVA